MNAHLSFTDVKNESRIFKAANSLIDSGIFEEIVIMGYHSDGLEKEQLLQDHIKIIRISLPILRFLPRHFRKALQLLCLWSKFLFFCVRHKPKVVNVHALELLFVGALVKLTIGSKLVYDAHELETERVVLSALTKKIAKIIERSLIYFADLTIVVGPMIEDYYRSCYGNINITTIRNCPPFSVPENKNTLRNDFNISKDAAIYIYSGSLNKSRNIPKLLDFFDQQSEQERVLVFMGKGPLEEQIKLSNSFGRSIFYKPAVAPQLVAETAANADFGIHLGEDICLSYRLCMPNKMFEYIMARLPLLLTDLPEMSKIVSAYNIGNTVSAIDNQTLLVAMKSLEASPKDKLKTNLDKAASDLNWENEEKRLISAIKKITQQ